jgi:hypothetical protein
MICYPYGCDGSMPFFKVFSWFRSCLTLNHFSLTQHLKILDPVSGLSTAWIGCYLPNCTHIIRSFKRTTLHTDTKKIEMINNLMTGYNCKIPRNNH